MLIRNFTQSKSNRVSPLSRYLRQEDVDSAVAGQSKQRVLASTKLSFSSHHRGEVMRLRNDTAKARFQRIITQQSLSILVRFKQAKHPGAISSKRGFCSFKRYIYLNTKK